MQREPNRTAPPTSIGRYEVSIDKGCLYTVTGGTTQILTLEETRQLIDFLINNSTVSVRGTSTPTSAGDPPADNNDDL